MKRFWFRRPHYFQDRGQAQRKKFRPEMIALEARDVPATFYFDPNPTINGNMATWNAGRPDAHTGVLNPATPVDGAVYTFLDDVGNATLITPERDTVRIAAGNITMTNPEVNTHGNSGDWSDPVGVDVIGSGRGVTILSPDYQSSSPTAFFGITNFFGNGTNTLSQLTIDGVGNQASNNFATGVAVNDAGTSLVINNVDFRRISFPSNGTQFGIGVNVKNGANVTVRNSTFTGIGRIGISGRDAGTEIQAFGNQYTGKGAGAVDYFVSIIDGARGLITGNRVTNNTGVSNGTRSAAVLIGDTSETGGPASAQIYANSFGLLANGTPQQNDTGVIVGFDSNDTSTADIRFNNLVGLRGVTGNLSASASQIIAFYNYWGSGSGPTATANPGGTGSQATANVNFGPIRGGPITPVAVGSLQELLRGLNVIGPTLAVGPGAGAVNGTVTSLALTGQGPFNATPGQSVGQRVTIGDVNGDGVNDIIVGSGPGTAATVIIQDGKTRATLQQFSVLDGFTGGVFVAAADFNRDGRAEVVVVPDQGGGTRVLIFDFSTGSPSQIQSFYALDENLRTGLTVAVGDLNGDRVPDMAFVAGPGGGPRVTFFDGSDVFSGSAPSKLFNDQYLYDENSRTGFFIALGDIDGDGIADVILSSNTGGNTNIQIWDGDQLGNGNAVVLFNITANPQSLSSGARIAAVDLNGDARADLVVGDGPGSSLVRVYFAQTTSLSTGNADSTVDLLSINTGIYVG